MELLMDYLLSRKAQNGTSPRRFDEGINDIFAEVCSN